MGFGVFIHRTDSIYDDIWRAISFQEQLGTQQNQNPNASDRRKYPTHAACLLRGVCVLNDALITNTFGQFIDTRQKPL